MTKSLHTTESFVDFYYTKVGMGEACGCAERIIDVYEFNRTGGKKLFKRVPGGKPKTNWRGVLRRLGLMSRPTG